MHEFRETLSFPDDPLGTCNLYPHVIDTGDSLPISNPPRVISEKERANQDEHVSNLLNDGVIRDSKSPWASLPHCVPKKTGETRMVIDYRKLNKVTKKDSFPLPNIELALSCLRGSAYFTILDLASGYHQVKMHESSIEKTAFITHSGLYEYVYMPFGLTNAPATFQRCVNKMLAGLLYKKVLCFLDDILIFSATFEEHVTRLREVLMRIKDVGFTIKPEKAFFCVSGISYLGHFVDSSGIKMQPSKVAAVQDFPVPKSVRDIKAFIGLCGYYRKFIPNFSKISEPLSRLTKKEEKFIFGPEQILAFETMRRKLLEPTCLIHYDPTIPVELHCDASYTGLGATIGHFTDEGFRPIQFASRLLSNAEKNYSVTDLEGLCLVWAVTKFSRYLVGTHFKIYTDHRPLQWLSSKAKLPRRLERYALELQGYDYEVVYKTGKSNLDADALSRFPVSSPEETNEHLKLFSLPILTDITELLEKIKKEQREDPFLSEIITDLEQKENRQVCQNDLESDLRQGCQNEGNGQDLEIVSGKTKRRVTGYFLQDGVLFRWRKRHTGWKCCLVIPETLREDIMFIAHDDLLGGCHGGVKRTLDRLRERFTFKDMETFVRKYVASCKSCQTKKIPTLKPAGMLKPIEVGCPFDMIGLDIFGPVKKSSRGNKYIITATDYLTKYVEIKAVARATEDECARFIVDNIISRHGCVSRILTDQGKCFAGKMIEKIYQILSIEKIWTTAYKPSTNGLTERFNKTLANMISQYVSASQRDWDIFLPLIMLTHNGSVQASTGYSPFFLLHGYEPRFPVDVTFEIPFVRGEDYAQSLQEKLELARKVAKENIEKAGERNKKYYDRKHREVTFKVGQQVLVYYPRQMVGTTNKFLHKFRGPFVIQEVLPNNLVIVRDINGRANKKVNIRNLKVFNERVLYDEDSSSEEEREVEVSNTGLMEALKILDSIQNKKSKTTIEVAEDSDVEDSIIENIERENFIPTPPPLIGPFLDPESSDQESDVEKKEGKEGESEESESEKSESAEERREEGENSNIGSQEILRDETDSNDSFHTAVSEISNENEPISEEPQTRRSERIKSKENFQFRQVRQNDESRQVCQNVESRAPKENLVDEGPGTNVVTLRRSKRERVTNPKYVLTLLFLLLSPVNTSFTRVNPIVWRESGKHVVSGITDVYADVIYESPCMIFNSTLTTRFEPFTVAFRSWCDELFEESWTKPLEKFCETPSTLTRTSMNRPKRFIITAVSFGAVVVTVLAQVGFNIYTIIERAYSNSEVDKIKFKQMEEIKNLELYQDNGIKMKNILYQLESTVGNLSEIIKEIADKLSVMINRHADILTTVAHLSSKLSLIKERLHSIGHDWKSNVFSPKLLDTFNITLPCAGRCPTKLFKPVKCAVDRMRNSLTFAFQQLTVKQTSSVLKADSFTLWSKLNETYYCPNFYVGPQSVIYDRRVDCVTNWKDNGLETVLAPSIEYCTQASPQSSNLNYWKESECKNLSSIRDDEIIQIKNTVDFNIIYCYTKSIHVFNNSYTCPSYPFSLPIHTSFMIDHLKFSADQLSLHSSLKVIPIFSNRINLHLMINSPNIKDELEQLKLETKSIHFNHTKNLSENNSNSDL